MNDFNYKKINNKGNTLINVIVTLGFIGILASLVLVVTNNNILMKLVDKDSKENFYSAESAMDVVEAGLQIDMSVSMLDAYYAIVDDYDHYIGNTDNLINDFNKYVMNGVGTTGSDHGFIKRLQGTSSSIFEGTINIDHINDYFSTASFGGTIEIKGTQTGGTIKYKVDTLYSYMVVKGFSLTYKNDGFEDTIQTDLFIKVPTPDYSLFQTESPNSAFNKYAVIANNNIVSSNSGDSASITGSAWAGNSIKTSNGANIALESDNVYAGGNEYSGYDSTGVRNNANINLYGGILVGKDSSKVTLKKEGIYNSTIAARNIIVDSILDITGGSCYVTNNLHLRQKDSVASISGNYNGVGEGGSSFSSSSIIVNRKASSEDAGLKMRLKTLSIAGSAYIRPYNFGNDFTQTTDSSGNLENIEGTEILTGESVAVSGNQVAYLVPLRFLPFSSNPVTKSEYQKFLDKNEFKTFKTEYNTAIHLGPSESIPDSEYISEYIGNKIFKSKESIMVTSGLSTSSASNTKKTENVKTVYYKPQYGGDGVVYFYLNFASTEKAANYYAQSVVGDANRNAIGSLVKANIDIEADNYKINGNFVTKSGDAGYTFNEMTTEPSDADGNIITYLRYYLQDTQPLDLSVYTYTPSNDSFKKYSGVDNIIDTALIKECTNTSDVDDDGYIMNKNDETYSALIIDGDYEVNSDFTGIILASGNITIKNTKVRGLVISCNGDVILSGANATLISDESMIATMINRSATFKTENGKKLRDFFRISAAESNSDDAIVSMDGMITYENWTRK